MIMKKLIETVDRMSHAAKNPEGPKFKGYWKGSDKNPPKAGVGVGGMEENLIKDLDKTTKNKSLEWKLAEDYKQFNEGEYDANLTLTTAAPTLYKYSGPGFYVKNNGRYLSGKKDTQDQALAAWRELSDQQKQGTKIVKESINEDSMVEDDLGVEKKRPSRKGTRPSRVTQKVEKEANNAEFARLTKSLKQAIAAKDQAKIKHLYLEIHKLEGEIILRKERAMLEGEVKFSNEATTRGGYGGNSAQATNEIAWIKKKIESLKPLLAKRPSVIRQIKDLERQIRERELSIVFNNKDIKESNEHFQYEVLCDKYTKGKFVGKDDAIASAQKMIYGGEKEYTHIEVKDLDSKKKIWVWDGKKDVREGWESGPEERTPRRERDPDFAYDQAHQDKLDAETKTSKKYYVYDGMQHKAVSKDFNNVKSAVAASSKIKLNKPHLSIQTRQIRVNEGSGNPDLSDSHEMSDVLNAQELVHNALRNPSDRQNYFDYIKHLRDKYGTEYSTRIHQQATKLDNTPTDESKTYNIKEENGHSEDCPANYGYECNCKLNTAPYRGIKESVGLDAIKQAYGTLSKINPTSPTYLRLIKLLDSLPMSELKCLADADIKFVSVLAQNRISKKSVKEDGGLPSSASAPTAPGLSTANAAPTSGTIKASTAVQPTNPADAAKMAQQTASATSMMKSAVNASAPVANLDKSLNMAAQGKAINMQDAKNLQPIINVIGQAAADPKLAAQFKQMASSAQQTQQQKQQQKQQNK